MIEQLPSFTVSEEVLAAMANNQYLLAAGVCLGALVVGMLAIAAIRNTARN